MSVSNTLLKELKEAGFTLHPDNKGVLVSKKFKDTIVAASPASAREAIRDMYAGGPGYKEKEIEAGYSTNDTGEYNEAREKHIREYMEIIAHYAEDGPTLDPDGKYLCGTCKFRVRNDSGNENKCYIMEGKADMEVGSCDDYTHGDPDAESNPLPMFKKYPQAQLGYAERPKAKGFGCSRCEYGAEAKKPDSEGRESWCRMFGAHIRPKACCSMNDGDDLVKPYDIKIEAATETSQQGDKEGTLWNGIKITGFTGPEEEGLRAMLSRIPPELLNNVSEIQSAKELNAKHGRFIPETKVIQFNPTNFSLRQRMGKGQGWVYHAELTVVHEVGHSIYSTLSPEQKTEWHTIGGWKKGWSEGQAPAYVERRPGWEPMTSTWTHKKGLALPRYYSEKTPNECFSDCFAFYLLNKANQMSPDIKSFMDNLIKERVKKYPQASIQSPIHAGGPGSGRHKENFVTLYHGTDLHNINSIKRIGLEPRTNKEREGKVYKGKAVFVSKNRNIARWWGHNIAWNSSYEPSRYAIVKLNVPTEEFKSSYSKDFGDPGSHFTTSKIPAKYIEHIEITHTKSGIGLGSVPTKRSPGPQMVGKFSRVRKVVQRSDNYKAPKSDTLLIASTRTTSMSEK